MKQVYRFKDADFAVCHHCATIHFGRGELPYGQPEKIIGTSARDLSQKVRSHIADYRHSNGEPCPVSSLPTNRHIAKTWYGYGVRLYRNGGAPNEK